MPAPHEVLGIPKNAGFKEAQAAYRKLLRQAHPDMGGTDAAFIELNEAWHDFLESMPPSPEVEAEKRRAKERKNKYGSLRQAAGPKKARPAPNWFKRLLDFIASLLARFASGSPAAFVASGGAFGTLLSLSFRRGKAGIFSAVTVLLLISAIWLAPERYSSYVYVAAVAAAIASVEIMRALGARGRIFAFAAGLFGTFAFGTLGAAVWKQLRPKPDVPPPIASPAPALPTAPVPARYPAPNPSEEPTLFYAVDQQAFRLEPGISYRFMARTGHATALSATRGQVRFLGDQSCSAEVELPMQAARLPYGEFSRLVAACGDGAVVTASVR